MADAANSLTEHYDRKLATLATKRAELDEEDAQIEDLKKQLEKRQKEIKRELKTIDVETDQHTRWKAKASKDEYDSVPETPIDKQPQELKHIIFDKLDWYSLAMMAQVSSLYATMINTTKKYHDMIDKMKTRWQRPARLLFFDAHNIVDSAIVRDKTVWLRQRALDMYSGAENADLHKSDPTDTAYVLGDGPIPCAPIYNYAGAQCAYFYDQSALMSFNWTTGVCDTVTHTVADKYAIAGCNGNLYVSVNNTLRRYQGSVHGHFDIIQTFKMPVCSMCTALDTFTPDDAFRLSPLVVVSESLMVYRPDPNYGDYFSRRDYVVVVEVDEEIEVTCLSEPSMVAYSNRTLAIAAKKRHAEEETFPSEVWLHCKTDDPMYTHGVCFPKDGICQIIGDGYGAFIVRTFDNKVYRLTKTTGYERIPLKYISVTDTGVESEHTLSKVYNMFFDKDNLMIMGDTTTNNGATEEARIIVFDPDYKYESSFP